jgi:anti-sigma-K factor RskA
VSDPAGSGRERLVELLADRATQGLSREEARELEALLRQHPDVDPDALDRVAAAVYLATAPRDETPLPGALRARIERVAPTEARPTRDPGRRAPQRTTRLRLLAAAGWAIAASLAFVMFRPPDLREMDPAARRAELLERAPDVVRVAWTKTEDPAAANAEGDVVWSDSRQEGFMRFRGLAPNDPTRTQYQLWIFDVERDERYPVDGGVFDVRADGETIVPIRAKLRVAHPRLFAISVERAGGVVVSGRERLPLVAPVEG